MSDLTQDSRLISISSPLDDNELLLTSFEGTEYISDLFEFQIEVLSSNHAIKPEQLIGKTVSINIHNDVNRFFNGYISRFTYGEGKADNLRTYHLTMVPWLWFLSKTNNHRIFQKMSTKDIITKVFEDLNFNSEDFEFKATGNPTKREYCVQHNETDLNFISRLLEEDGISYYFEQTEKKHKMIIVDAANAHQLCAETDLTYSKGNATDSQLSRWEHVYEFRKGKWSLDDYDFNTPTKDQFQTIASTSKFANAKKYEHYEYTPYHDFAGLKDLTKKRIEAEETPLNIIEASSDCSSFYAGGKFALEKHTAKEELGTYIITGIRHRAYDNSYLAGQESATGYSNDFSCIPEKVHFRPPMVHQKPSMLGPQSAVVVGASGDEIHTDALGRIRVQFHWDREGKNDDKSTCYIRVVQPWAGAGWGTSFIPRVGMEVIVNFLDGDPDRPIITGSVYNGDNAPPFSSKTQSGIRTRSTKKGTASNCNELRFDDLKDSEQIFIHAEKNMDTSVENNETLTIDNDRTKTVKHDENSTIENNRNKTVNKNQTETIAINKTIDVGGDHTETIKENMTISVDGNLRESVEGAYIEAVTKEYGLKAKTITMQADDQITLKTGSAKIVMKSNGDITISGNNINLKGSGNVVIKGSKVTTN